jgi:site-specific recombinase XerD
MAESRLRNHVRPFFGDRAIDKIGPAEIRRWQTQLAATTGHATVQQCRSLLLRIFQYAVDEGALDANPVRKVAVPSTPAALALMSRFLLVGWRAAGFVHKPARRIFSGRYLGWD